MTPPKIMLLGDIGVGKSSIARRLAFNQFDPDYKPTLGVDIYSCELPHGPHGTEQNGATSDPEQRFILWDVDGNFGDSILSLVYIKNAAGALIIGDLTRSETLDTMLALGRSFMQAMPGRYCGLLLNKSDLMLPDVALPAALLDSQLPIERTSAKTGDNVERAFLRAADAIRRRAT